MLSKNPSYTEHIADCTPADASLRIQVIQVILDELDRTCEIGLVELVWNI